jgi:hypothetical protein
MTPHEQAAKWLEDYFAMASEIKAHEAMQDDVRRNIEAYVLEHGPVKVDHVGAAIVTPASTSHSYDTKAIDELLAQCVADGDIGTARTITDARKVNNRKPTLRITASR